MHNLALQLQKQGFEVTGSDDEIFEPSRSRLAQHGLLPAQMGWFPEHITPQLDAVILGMHARQDNPELLRAQELGLKIYSYPEYIYENSKNKQRVVVAGSHGKTTVTSMIIHVLKYWGQDPDYMVGASLKGLDTPVKLSADSPVIIIEGDEYLTSPLDLRPKFIHYQHHIGVITGIAWDHINVYPDYKEYERQFQHFVEMTPKAGALIYCEEDKALKEVVKHSHTGDISLEPYKKQKSKIEDGVTYLTAPSKKQPIKVFGDHNLQNISAALAVCARLGISEEKFYEAIASFEGAAFRMQLLAQKGDTRIFRDFAHAPSKVKATVEGFSKQFGKQRSIGVLELHTFSSLNKAFLPHYKGSMEGLSEAIVYFNPETVAHKKLETISEQQVADAFAQKGLKVFSDSEALKAYLLGMDKRNANVLIMTSGNLNGLDLQAFAQELAG